VSDHNPLRLPRLTRRTSAIAGAAALTLALSATYLPGSAQQPAPAATAEDIHKPGDLGDIIIGKPDAPVTIVEYASMTCPHCATFHNTVLPTLKQKYVDAGQVRIIFREYPLDNVAVAVSMLARCAGSDKAPAVVAKFFETQDQWAFVKISPLPGMLKVAETVGFTKESFDKCLTDQKMMDGVRDVGERGRKLGVTSTPSFFVNGKKLEGRADQVATFEKAIEPLLKK
jgi:protein-disulfide isomerase